MLQACFLDRDGVVNEEVNYLHTPEETVLIPGTAEALRRLHEAGFLAVVVTNQAGVAKSLFPESDVGRVHRRIQELLAADNERIDDFFYCPHHPDFTGACNCRKPAPGMLLAAAEKWDIDLGRSFLIGDRMSDINAGRNAGLAECYLVLTGYGKTAKTQPEAAGVTLAQDPLAAVMDFLSRRNNRFPKR
ncbi:MAG: HAD family hydrolase [Victivallaceae bacterium]|nr:HAD family hydrolase [Victivallaceae bacterium]